MPSILLSMKYDIIVYDIALNNITIYDITIVVTKETQIYLIVYMKKIVFILINALTLYFINVFV